jgi:hypothetical protein
MVECRKTIQTRSEPIATAGNNAPNIAREKITAVLAAIACGPLSRRIFARAFVLGRCRSSDRLGRMRAAVANRSEAG